MAMTNEELISELRKLPAEAPVSIFTSENQFRNLDQVEKVSTVDGKPVIILS
jgi:hypothetical protein